MNQAWQNKNPDVRVLPDATIRPFVDANNLEIIRPPEKSHFLAIQLFNR
jgi:hypothetical protein